MFTEAEAKRLVHHYNDALVILICIFNTTVRRILVDNGSSVNVIYKEAFDQLAVRLAEVRLVSVSLMGFLGAPVMPVGSVRLRS